MSTSQELWDEAEASFAERLDHALALEQVLASHALEMREWKKAQRDLVFAIRRAERARRRAEHVGRVLRMATRVVARDKDAR